MEKINFQEEKVFPASKEVLPDVLEYVEEQLNLHECSMKLVMQITMAIEEIFVNVACYAYPDGKGNVKLSISFDEETKEMTFCFMDQGVPFDPLAKPDPDVTASAEDRQIGGLGIYLVKKTMDEVTYCYENDSNILTMKKTLL